MKSFIRCPAIATVFAGAVMCMLLCACAAKNSEVPGALAAIGDEALARDFAEASAQIGMDAGEIKNLEKSADWAGGPLYTFSYKGTGFLLYADMDSTVKSIRQGPLGTDIYSKGYEPYQVSDYIADSSITAQLQAKAQEYVKDQLKYPEEAAFPWLDWSSRRERSLYTVASTVTAKNAMGVKQAIPFELTFDVGDGAYRLVYFNLDGEVIKDETSGYRLPERKWVGYKTAEGAPGAITLVYGELGEYGKKVTMSGFAYIHYYVPIGKYEVTNNGIRGWISVDKDEITKNASGFDETVTVTDHPFQEYGEKTQIEVKAGEHIELSASTNVTLIPIQ